MASEPELLAADPDEEVAAPAGGGGERRGASGSAISVGSQFILFPELPLPELDQPGAKAYAAEMRHSAEKSIYGLVSSNLLPYRDDVISFLAGVHIDGQVDLVDYEIAHWPQLGRNVVIYILQRPGELVLPAKAKQAPVNEHEMGERIVAPIVNVLSALADKGYAHRQVTVNNIYWANEDQEVALLGPGFIDPPGYGHSVLYETLPRMLAHPAGRGKGELADDLYMLGVALAVISLGGNPMRNMDEEAIVRAKLEKGSFQAIVGSARVPLTLLEPIRGLLCDDPDDRWTMNELRFWLDGRRLGPLQAQREKRAARAQSFAGGDYFTLRTLADAMSRNWAQALSPINEGHIDVWLRRGMSDNDRAKKLHDVMRTSAYASSDKRTAEDLLIARSIIVLDPDGPVRHKNFTCMIDGFGPALAHALLEGGGPQAWAETVSRDIPKSWFECQTDFNPALVSLPDMFKSLKYYIQQNGPGYGVERCLYVTNPGMHCLSPLVDAEHVVHIGELLPALNKAAQRADQSQWPMDRHIAAFIAARAEEDVEAQLAALENPSDQVEYSRAILSLLALVQWRTGTETVHDLCGWVGQKMGPTVKVFHSRERRERVEREIPKLVRKGSIIDLYNLINDEDERRRDQLEFTRAVDEYSSAEAEIFDLDSSGPARLEMAERLGQQVAAVACNMIAVITVASLLIMYIW